MDPTQGNNKSQILTLPNELLREVASHLTSFKDLNSLIRTFRFFHEMFNPYLYRRAATADDAVREDIVGWVLSKYRLASLTLLLDNGLPVDYTGQFDGHLDQSKRGYFEHIQPETMLHFVCRLYDKDPLVESVPLARLLLQRGADIKAEDGEYSQPVLYKAIRYHQLEIVELLFAHGADPNAAEFDGEPPLHFACREFVSDNVDMINLLLAHGADVKGCSASGDYILTSYHLRNKPRVTAALLEHGADAGVHNKHGETPLHNVAAWFESQHHELAKSLLEHGAKTMVNATDDTGRTPLHFAIEFHWFDEFFMANFLIENGADVNATTNGHSILMSALHSQCGRDTILLLLEHGADFSVLNGSDTLLLTGILRNPEVRPKRRGMKWEPPRGETEEGGKKVETRKGRRKWQSNVGRRKWRGKRKGKKQQEQ
jgi:ankyrin repeat protein